jgi:hypothetical protein
MKGKNKPTRRQKKKQFVIIEEKKAGLRSRLAAAGAGAMKGEGQPRVSAAERAERREAAAAEAVPAGAPKALARFYRRGVD